MKKIILGEMSLKELKWFDLPILAAIMFSQAIYQSTIMFIASLNVSAAGYGAEYGAGYESAVSDVTAFTTAQNYNAILTELMLIALAFIYLRLRKFDFSMWKIRITPKSIALGVAVFIAIAALSDILYVIYSQFTYTDSAAAAYASDYYAYTGGSDYGNYIEAASPLLRIDLSLILFALLNGFFEEIFFLGMCMFVNPKYRWISLAFSLAIRFSFHTYQGIYAAFSIMFVLGTLFYFLYEKTGRKNLFPFFLGHSIADVFGLSLLYYASSLLY